MRDQLNNTELETAFIKDADDAEVRDLFIRLQSGSPLNNQEKRDAYPGDFTDFILKLGGKDSLRLNCYSIPIMIDKDGMLKFAIGEDDDPPDFEAPRGTSPMSNNTNTYKVVVVASDKETGGMMGYHKVMVMVTDVDEEGKVAWTVTPAGGSATEDLMQFQVGAILAVSATGGVTDGDVSGSDKNVTERLQWYRSSSKTGMGTAIGGQTAADYTVTTEDVGKRLRVVVAYTVGTGREESASLTSDYPVLEARTNNDAPEFSPATVTREVSEGDKGMTVGAPVRATDDITNALNYMLSGVDMDRFKIDQKTGQITTLVDLDREGLAVANASTLGSCADATTTLSDPECTVTVTATDSAGEASSPVATVTITITNVDEKPTFSTTGSAMGMKMISQAEGMTALNSTVANVTYMAMDPDGLQVNLTLMGDDAAKFKLTYSTDGGVLSFKEKPDYEMPADMNKDNVYEVTVQASDGAMYTDRMVMVTVTDADEAPEIIEGGLSISGSQSMNFSEGDTDAVATYTASGPMKDMAMWTLEGDDHMYFRVGTTRGAMTELMFRSAPDYEMPRGRAMSDTNTNTYKVTLKANDGMYMDTHKVTVMVTNMEEMGTVKLSSMNPVVGVALTATLTDPDGGVMNEMWQWSKSMTMNGTFMVIGEATMMSYTPMAADEGYYLRATATYTDGCGDGCGDAEDRAKATTMMVPDNSPPMFGEGDAADRMVDENTAAGENIGAPVMATDADDDTLTYTLGGADAMYFAIGESKGQLMTKAALDYEMPRGQAMSDANTNDYMVTVTATDPDGARDSIMVTIMVTNVEDELAARYDINGTPGIQKDEVITAINDYLFGTGADVPSKADVISLINLYLFG